MTMRPQLTIAVAMFLTLVPVTLLVPGLHELVAAHGGSDSDAHAFMVVNMVAGMIAVPVTMRLLRRWSNVRAWLVGALLLDAVAFVGMRAAPSLGALYAFRVLDGAAHLPAVTMLMMVSNRLSGERRGGALGALASAVMIGVAVGSPLGGWLVERGPATVYAVGAALLVASSVTCAFIGTVPSPATPYAAGGRYRWNRASLPTWIPLGYGFMDRFTIGIFVSTFTLFLRQVHALSASERGILIALFMLPFALLCYPAGRLADRIGWLIPMILGGAMFGLVFASYGVAPRAALPVVMLLSGIFSALMYSPNLLLISDLAQRGQGEGLFGAFQVAGAFGFLIGPIAGGILVAVTRDASGIPAYRAIFAGVGGLETALAVASYSTLRHLARDTHGVRRMPNQSLPDQPATGGPVPA
jgi:MFS family permease